MKKYFRPTLFRPTRFSVMQTIHSNVGPKCFLKFHRNVCLLLMYAYFIDISQGCVQMHLRCGGIYNNHIIADCLQSVPVNEF